MNCAVIAIGFVLNVIVADCANDTVVGAQVRAVAVNERASTGDTFDGIGFIEPQPFPSWLLVNRQWLPPIPRPNDAFYVWDETIIGWRRIGERNGRLIR